MVTGRGAGRQAVRSNNGRTDPGEFDIGSSISIVIPAFNEISRLPSSLDRLVSALPDFGQRRVEIIVSDDGSTDGTADAARRVGGVRVVEHSDNRGKGAALLAGIAASTHAVVVLLDADLPVTPDSIAALAGRLDARPTLDLLVGSRRMPGSIVDPPQPLTRRAGGRLFLSASRLMGYRTTSDPQCGVKLLRRERVAAVLPDVMSAGFAFDIELIVRARRAGLVVEEVPVHWRHVPGSSLRPVRDALRTLGDLARLRQTLPLGPPSRRAV